jgi:hypothetical protein
MRAAATLPRQDSKHYRIPLTNSEEKKTVNCTVQEQGLGLGLVRHKRVQEYFLKNLLRGGEGAKQPYFISGG